MPFAAAGVWCGEWPMLRHSRTSSSPRLVLDDRLRHINSALRERVRPGLHIPMSKGLRIVLVAMMTLLQKRNESN